MARLKDMYKADVAPALLKKYEYKSVMQIPKLDKVIINVGVGDAKENSKAIDNVINDITLIAGQKAVPTYARKSVANFKLRQGMKIGVKVTLRGERMYEFVDKLFTFVPRNRVRQGGKDPRHGHCIRDHSQDRRRSERSALDVGRTLRKVREGG